jgi:hypothetical protein
MLEEYAFNRLSESEVESLEEHVLICSICQDRLRAVDQYILLMKKAAAQLQAPAQVRTRRATFALWMWAGAAAAVITAGMLLTRPAAPSGRTMGVELASFRGGAEVAHAMAGRPLDLAIDLSDLSPAVAYRVQVVNAAGSEEWSGRVTASGAKIVAHLAQPLRRGQHWVRVSSADGQLLREFGLRAD